MYKVTLRPRKNNPFLNEIIYWYPISINEYGSLISFNITTIKGFEEFQKYSNKGYILSKYSIGENMCFIYNGSKLDRLIESFGEKSFITYHREINYFFSEIELEYIYKGRHYIKNSSEIAERDLENFTGNELKKIFDEEWEIKLSVFRKKCKYSTNLVSPHPLLHLIDIIDYEEIKKRYSQEMLLYLLKKDFLVTWIDPKDISANLLNDIFNKHKELLNNKTQVDCSLKQIIQKIVSDLFDKYNIFPIVYLAVQCGSSNSAIKILMNNLYSLLPAKTKEYIQVGSRNFQPTFAVRSIEIHFIKTTPYKTQLYNIYELLDLISDEINFYDKLQHKTLTDENSIIIALTKDQPLDRYRFICKMFISPPIDYSLLPLKVSDFSNAITTILKKKTALDDEVDSVGEETVNIKELWVKKIGLSIKTPPQFENDVTYSLSRRKWQLLRDENNMDTVNEDNSKTLFIDISCDYPVFIDDDYSFSFDFTRDMQYVYTVLNESLKTNHNFYQFSSQLQGKNRNTT